MLRYAIALTGATLLITMMTRSPAVRRWLHVMLGLLALYAVLKMTGMIDSFDPRGDGVF